MLGPVEIKFIFTILLISGAYGWMSGLAPSNQRPSAQRRAMREDCRSKGL